MVTKCVCGSVPEYGKSVNSPYDWFAYCVVCDSVPAARAFSEEEVLEEWRLNVNVIKKSKGTSCKVCFHYVEDEEADKNCDYGYCNHPSMENPENPIETVLAAKCEYFTEVKSW